MIDVFITEEEIRETVKNLGRKISEDYAEKEIFIIPVLKGSAIFASDLIRSITVPLALDFIEVSSYSGTESNGIVTFKKDINTNIAGKHILIVEDIVDTGRTLAVLKQNLMKRNPASFKVCSFLSKPSRREIEADIEYIGIEIEDKFVIGYGMDFDEKYRNLPYIGVIRE